MTIGFALTFVVDPFGEAVEDRLLADGMMTSSRDQLHQVSTYSCGDTCLDAAQETARQIENAGAKVRRLDLELVTQAEIAERVGVTRSAVNKWVHQAEPGATFPMPHTATPAIVWSWGEVNEWLRRHKTDRCEDARTPGPAEVCTFNAAWTTNRPITVRTPAVQSEFEFELVTEAREIEMQAWVSVPNISAMWTSTK